MTTYSTGELAKLGQVSVRTLQYYDQRGLLRPSTVTEGGRRQYSDADLDRLQLILLLKEMNLSLKSIQEIITSQQANKTLSLLLDEQLRHLKAERNAATDKIKRIEQIRHELPDTAAQPITSQTDIEQLFAQKRQLHQVHRHMILLGVVLDLIEFSGLIYALQTKNWIPFIGGMVLVVGLAIWISYYYFREINFVCPNCQTIFQPKFGQMFIAAHNFKARKLKCPHCHQTNYCIEIAAVKANNKQGVS
ncbi:MerR family transcriptional regulator [Lapidilactobacillus wuchangensis]|uniref:MerR family transcriptional regulator n=1 Tax=Lapidilactobacillus wuchangensis TaxID=2486001 RepID=UPI0013DE14E0|nr:MerR family transcriptional regulator [Lapidilactobacillus wuchangensis]